MPDDLFPDAETHTWKDAFSPVSVVICLDTKPESCYNIAYHIRKEKCFEMDNEKMNPDAQDELDDDIVILEDEDGNAVTFRFLELVTLGETPYAVLLPLDDEDDEGGVVIVEVVDLGLESEHYDAVVDDDLNNRIFEQFRKEFGDKYEFE